MAIYKFLRDKLVGAFAHGTASAEEGGLEITKTDVVHIIKGLCTAILSYILGSSGVLFSSYPFGIAFLCAVSKFVPYSYVGLLISSIGVHGYYVATAVIYTVIIMLRFALCRLFEADGMSRETDKKARFSGVAKILKKTTLGNDTMFGESVLIRCAISCFAAFVFGLYRLISGGFLYYDLFGLLAGFLICPLSTLLLSGLFVRDGNLARFSELSFATLMFITVYALRDYSVFGFSPSFIAAFFITLWAASSMGALKGCAAGLLSGMACGGVEVFGISGLLEISYSLGGAPCMMAIAGLCVGGLWKLSVTAALTSAAVLAAALGLSIDGYGVLSRLLPDILCSLTLFVPLSRLSILPPIPMLVRSDADKLCDDAVILEKKQADSAQRMNSLSEAFAHLADTLFSLSDRVRRPGVADLKQVCDRSFDKFCSRCSMQSHCLERDYTSTLDAQSKLTAALCKNGKAELSDVPSFLRERCFNITAVIEDINRAVGKLIEKLIKTDKTEAFALDYEAMSRLLSEQISKNEAEYEIDTQLSERLRRSLKYMGMGGTRAICYGSRKKHVVIGGVDITRVKMRSDEIRGAVERTLGVYMDQPRFSIDDETVTVTLEARRRFKIESAKATGIKEHENANGDSAAIFENNEDYFYCLISDGMGSGKEAAITSKLCTLFVERMLSGGNGKAVTLEMLNGFIRSRGPECSATIDLAEIDLITGEACFVKSGAAPSFVLRGGNLYKLQSQTVPIGIMHELDAEKIRFDLKQDDILIMLSDGIAQSLEDGVWLANLLTYEWEDDLSKMAEKIIDNAVFNNIRSDDMTVVLARVNEAAAE